MRRSIATWAMLGALLVTGSFAMDAAAADPPAKGARRVYRDAGGLEWCVNVIAVDNGVDGRPWVWFGFVHDPRRVEHVPSDVLGPECPASNSPSVPVPLKSAPRFPPAS